MEKKDEQYVFMNEKEVASKIGVARSTLRRWAKEGVFPKPVELGPRLKRWTAKEVEQWLLDRVEKRTA